MQRESDKQLIESVIDEAVNTYKQMVIDQVVRFNGKSLEDIPCKITIDTKYLESIEDNEATGCIGGFRLFAKKGRIVCS